MFRLMNVLKRFRKQTGMSQEQLGAHLNGLTQAAISQYERGIRTMEPTVAHKFLDLARSHGFEATLEDVYPRPDSLPDLSAATGA